MEQAGSLLTPFPPPVAAQPDGPVNILLVDDDSGILETLVDVFEDMGYRIETASTGRLALVKIQENSYNLALLDIQLPDMQGTELLAQARRLQPDMKCIMATGNASLPSALDSLNQGAYAYLQKPIEVQHVKATVRSALHQQGLELGNRRLLRDLGALRDITDSALVTLELNELLARVLERLISYHEADGGVIYLLDAATGRLQPRIAQGPASTAAAEALEVGQGLVGQAAARNDVLAAAGEDLAFDAAHGRGVRAALAAPLRWRNALIGAIRLDRSGRQPFDAEQLELLRLFAARAGVFIGNARLYDEERLLHTEAQALSDLSGALVEQIGLDERMELVARHLMRVSGVSRCIIWLMTRETLSVAFAVGVDRHQHRLLQRNELSLEEAVPEPKRTLDLGAPVVVRDPSQIALLPAGAAAEWGVRTALLVPLRFEGKSIGLIALDEPSTPSDFTERQMRQAKTIADLSAGAIQQARTIQEERLTLTTLAESFLTRPPQRPDVQLASQYEPASVVAQVGGDYFDFIEYGDHQIGIVIGDVCGKERAAAIYVAMAKYMLRAYALQDPSPQQVITRLNRALYNQMSEECMFITMVYGIIDLKAGTFTYTNAGHPAPILYQPVTRRTLELKPGLQEHEVSSDGGEADASETTPRPSSLTPTDGMVGAIAEMEFTETTVSLEPGSVLSLFTDGVTEARTDHEMLESTGVQEVIREMAAESADAIATGIYDRALQFSGGMLRDDVAIVVVKNV